MGLVASRYALRGLRRNVRRTLLAVVGIAIGTALALVTDGINRGRDEFAVRAATASGIGHLRIVPEGWLERRDPKLRLASSREALVAADAVPGVEAAAPRARAQVLLAMGAKVVPVEMLGVVPALEPRFNRFVRTLGEGRFLREGASGEIVVGRAIASRLDSGIGDEVLATTVGPDGSLQSGMFVIVGIAATGSEEIDLGICQTSLEELERLSGLAGPSEIAVVLRDYRQLPAARDRLIAEARPDAVATWQELVPELAGHMEQDKALSRIVTGIVMLVVTLGVASAQLAAVLERRREFAVLAALGMRTGPMVRLVLAEALVLGMLGGALGLLLGAPLAWLLATRGLDFSSLLGGGATFSGILLDPVFRGDFGLWIIPEALVVALAATLLASLYPARFVARTDPAVALRVAQ